jgi:Mg2+/citrate symporter
MVHGIIYGLLVMVLLVTNLLHIEEKNRLKDNRDYWREKAVKNENELNALKEKQTKRKTVKK